MGLKEPLDQLSELRRRQGGMFTQAQASVQEVDRHTVLELLKNDRLEEVAVGVYRVRGEPDGRHPYVYAAWLQLDPFLSAQQRQVSPPGVVSHESAAQLFDLGKVSSNFVAFTVPTEHQNPPPNTRLFVGTLRDGDIQMIHGLPVTRVPRMVADLLADLFEPEDVAVVALRAIDWGLTTEAELIERLGPHAPYFDEAEGDGAAVLRCFRDMAG